jgi:hypothetical protein
VHFFDTCCVNPQCWDCSSCSRHGARAHAISVLGKCDSGNALLSCCCDFSVAVQLVALNIAAAVAFNSRGFGELSGKCSWLK